MPTVKTIDIIKAKKETKNCPLIVRQYVKGLEHAIEISNHTTQKAISKIKELSIELEKLKPKNK